jgi:BirA family biotin operon repressor/biotin-[acetyl-CoA-carboxylase] ligase
VADRQTAGRGRRGRAWQAARDKGLLCSILLRPSLAPAQAARLTMLAAVALARTVRRLGPPAVVKWPNDVLVGQRKVGGILVEGAMTGERMEYAVAGIGLNVNMTESDVAAIAPPATSLRLEMGRGFTRRRVLRLLLSEFWPRYRTMQQDGGEAIYGEWRALLDTPGRRVTVVTGVETVCGRAEDVDADGALLVRRDDGALVRITYGDVA